MRLSLRAFSMSKLAMVVNDYAGCLTLNGALRFIVGTPPGASSLLQGRPKP
jgi:hypothetical protein